MAANCLPTNFWQSWLYVAYSDYIYIYVCVCLAVWKTNEINPKGPLVTYKFARHFCSTLLSDTLAWHSCMTHLKDTLATPDTFYFTLPRHLCKVPLQDSGVRCSSSTFLFDRNTLLLHHKPHHATPHCTHHNRHHETQCTIPQSAPLTTLCNTPQTTAFHTTHHTTPHTRKHHSLCFCMVQRDDFFNRKIFQDLNYADPIQVLHLLIGTHPCSCWCENWSNCNPTINGTRGVAIWVLMCTPRFRSPPLKSCSVDSGHLHWTVDAVFT